MKHQFFQNHGLEPTLGYANYILGYANYIEDTNVKPGICDDLNVET